MKYHRKKTFELTILLLICLCVAGCDKALYPVEVSERFWRAVKDKDAKTIQKYTTKDSFRKSEDTENILTLDEITLGKTVIDGDSAWVDTTATIAGDQPLTIPLRTVLMKENKQWKVDYAATVRLISKDNAVSNVIDSIKNMSEDLAEELNRSMEGIHKAIPEVKEEVEKIEESLLEHVPELKKQIEKFVEDLKDALKELGKDSDKPTATET